MSRLYFDLQNGISGDMAVAALLGLETGERGAPAEAAFEGLRVKLATIDLGGYRTAHAIERRSGIAGHRFTVEVDEGRQKHRTYSDIRRLLHASGLAAGEKDLALDIFEELARAESLVHGVPAGDVHFHEIGAVDSIVDIAGFAILYRGRGVETAAASPIHLGTGKTESMHGTIPVPAPATLEIVKGLPVAGTDAPYELTTPTGAAIVKTTVSRFGPLPRCVIRGVGMGFGKRKSPGINALRIYEYDEIAKDALPADQLVAVIESSIDDSTPEEIGYLTEELFGSGALDVTVTPVQMKKNRPGFTVAAVSAPERLDACARAMLERSSTFGLRYQYFYRKTLDRTLVKVETRFGPISVKVGSLGGTVLKAAPEYEECKTAARVFDVPLREVFREAMAAFHAGAKREGSAEER